MKMTITPANAAIDPPSVPLPIGSRRMNAASTSAISGAMKVSVTACAIGIRARPQKNRTAIGTMMTPRSRWRRSAVPLGHGLRVARKGMAPSAMPIKDRQSNAAKVPTSSVNPFITMSMTENKAMPATAAA